MPEEMSMAKSKYAPALFEVIRDNKDAKPSGKLAVPKWWKGDKSPAVHDASAEKPQQATPPGPRLLRPDVVGEKAASTTEPASPSTWRGRARSEEKDPSRLENVGCEYPPVIRMNDGRIELSLNLVSAAVVLGVLVLTLFTTFELGRKVASPVTPTAQASRTPDSADTIKAALKLPPNANVLSIGGATALRAERAAGSQSRGKTNVKKWGWQPAVGQPLPSPATLLQEPVQRVSGLNYVILDQFKPDHKNAAEFAQKWLAEKYGIRTTLERSKTGRDWRLVSVEGFGQSAEYLPYCEKIRSLGKDLKRTLIEARLPVYGFTAPLAKKWD